MTRQCLANRRVATVQILGKETAAWSNLSNDKQRTVDWQFTIEDARIKLRDLYPEFLNLTRHQYRVCCSDAPSFSRNEGTFSQRCSSIPFSNHAWILSSRTTTAMRSRLCPTLLGELLANDSHFPLTYSLDTGDRPDGHGSNEHCQ